MWIRPLRAKGGIRELRRRVIGFEAKKMEINNFCRECIEVSGNDGIRMQGSEGRCGGVSCIGLGEEKGEERC